MILQAPQKRELYALTAINADGIEEIYLTEASHFREAADTANKDLGEEYSFEFEIVTPIN